MGLLYLYLPESPCIFIPDEEPGQYHAMPARTTPQGVTSQKTAHPGHSRYVAISDNTSLGKRLYA